MGQMGLYAQNIQTSWMPSVSVLGDMNGDVSDVQRLILKYILEQNPNTQKQTLQDLQNTLKIVQADRTKYQKYMSNAQEKSIYADFSRNYNAYTANIPAIIQSVKTNQYSQATTLDTQGDPLWGLAKNDIHTLIQLNKNGAFQETRASVADYHAASSMAIIFTIIALLLGITLAILISRRIRIPIQIMAKAAEVIASGDLTVEAIRVKNQDEIGALADSFNKMSSGLRETILKVSQSAEQVAASAEQLNASAEESSQATQNIAMTIQEVSIGSDKQAQNTEETAKSVNAIAASAEQIAVSAQNVSMSALNASEIATEGANSISLAIQQMDSIHTTVEGLVDSAERLGQRSKEIEQIVNVITDIATQTNLLSLNAAIEAARAGEHGRGFAVVADEVRKLAEQSGQSAKKIVDLIGHIQTDIDEAIRSTGVATTETQTGIQVVTTAGVSFTKIQNAVQEVSSQIQEVSAAVEEMSAETEQIVQTIDQISEIAVSNASGTQTVSAAAQEQLASMEEIAASATSLAQMAEELQNLVGQFKI